MFACCGLALGVAQAHAQPLNAASVLVLGADADACLSSEPLSVRIAHYGKGATPQPGTRVVLVVQGRNAVELRIFRAGVLLSRRRFEQLPASCVDSRDAIALSIALALESSSVSEPGRSGPDDAATAAETSPAEPVSARPAPASAPPTAAETQPVVLGSMPASTTHRTGHDAAARWQLHLGARYLTQAAPMGVWAGALGAQLALTEHVALDLSAFASLPGDARFGSGRARARLWGLELLGCRSLPLAPFALQACAGAAAAACGVSGRDYPIARADSTLLWAAGLARVTLAWPAQELLTIRLVLQAHLNVSRPELRVEGVSGSLHPGLLGATLGLELLLRLP